MNCRVRVSRLNLKQLLNSPIDNESCQEITVFRGLGGVRFKKTHVMEFYRQADSIYLGGGFHLENWYSGGL